MSLSRHNLADVTAGKDFENLPSDRSMATSSNVMTPWWQRTDGLLWFFGLLFGSFLATQMILVLLQRKRIERIEKKSLRLCGSENEATSKASATAATEAEASADASAGTETQSTEDGRRETQSRRRVPVTLITGFLGSGKTTLVNRLLTGVRLRVS